MNLKIGPLSLVSRTNRPGLVNLAAWHWRGSITWSWILSIDLSAGDRRFGAWRYRTNGGLQWGVIAFRRSLRWHRQEPMWRRPEPPRRDGVRVMLPPDFDVDDGACVLCGGELDTGWECNSCGADHFPAVKAIMSKEKFHG